jgi:hypothetical protein
MFEVWGETLTVGEVFVVPIFKIYLCHPNEFIDPPK